MACDPLTQSPDTIHILNGQRGKIANSLGFFFFYEIYAKMIHVAIFWRLYLRKLFLFCALFLVNRPWLWSIYYERDTLLHRLIFRLYSLCCFILPAGSSLWPQITYVIYNLWLDYISSIPLLYVERNYYETRRQWQEPPVFSFSHRAWSFWLVYYTFWYFISNLTMASP